MEITLGAATLPGGLTLSYAERGDPAGLPVLLLHGLSDSWISFQPVLAHLPAALRAIAVSQRGHGDSDRPPGGYAPELLAADIAGLMDVLDIPAAVIVGQSMGSAVAARFAADHPSRCLGLVLVGATMGWREHPEIADLRDAVAALADPVDPDFVRAFQESTIAQPIPPGFLDLVVAESLKLPAAVWRAALAETLLEPDPLPVMRRIAAPTLILCGDRDTLCWAGQPALARALPAAGRLTYQGAGHALHWEEPARFASDLSRFASALGALRPAHRLAMS
jgi:pimeloyl-ACP methyl ester carboxylesterase